MTICFLNVNRGEQLSQLLDFLTEKRSQVDVWCFQEVTRVLEGEIYVTPEGILPDFHSTLLRIFLDDFTSYYSIHVKDDYQIDPNIRFDYGLACFIKKNQTSKLIGEPYVWDSPGEHISDGISPRRRLQVIKVADTYIFNFHGLWQRVDGLAKKADSPERQAQLQMLMVFLTPFLKRGEKVILGGDFNLRPDSETLLALQDMGFKNLIDPQIHSSTRTPHYENYLIEPYADYVLVSPQIEVEKFWLEERPVSDHKPMFLRVNQP